MVLGARGSNVPAAVKPDKVTVFEIMPTKPPAAVNPESVMVRGAKGPNVPAAVKPDSVTDFGAMLTRFPTAVNPERVTVRGAMLVDRPTTVNPESVIARAGRPGASGGGGAGDPVATPVRELLGLVTTGP
jgi:hypothetical protein